MYTIRDIVHKRTVNEVMKGLLNEAYAKAERDIVIGKWDGLKQLKLEGLELICDNTIDIDLRTLAWLQYLHGFKFDFALLDKKEIHRPSWPCDTALLLVFKTRGKNEN